MLERELLALRRVGRFRRAGVAVVGDDGRGAGAGGAEARGAGDVNPVALDGDAFGEAGGSGERGQDLNVAVGARASLAAAEVVGRSEAAAAAAARNAVEAIFDSFIL